MKTFTCFIVIFILLFPTFNHAQQGGYALQFDGNDDYVNCGNSTNVQFGGAITIECWVKKLNSNHAAFVSKLLDNASKLGYEVYSYNTNTFAFNFGRNNADWYSLQSTTILNLGTWYHVACTYDGTTAKIYINGKLENSTTYTNGIVDPGTPLCLGKRYDNFPFNGLLDEVRIWNVVRTEAQIKTNMFKELAGNESGLRAYYKMSNGSGTTLTDNQTNVTANTGTLTDGPVWKASGCFAGSRQALDFDGTNDYVNLPASFSNALDGLQHFSFCGWVYHTTINTGLWGTYFTRYNASDWKRVTFHSLPSSDKYGYDDIMISISNETYGQAFTTTNVLETGKWIHLSVVYDGTQSTNAGKVKIYVNGVQETLDFDGTTFPASFGTVDQYQYLGRYHNPDYFKGGQFDEFSFWNVSLTESEIRQLMFKSLAGNESGLFAYYRFDHTDGTTLYDMTSNGHNGTLTNMDGATDWVSSSAVNTWIGGDSNGWSTAGNWSNGAPSSAQSSGIYNWSSSLPNVTTYLPVIPATVSVNNLLVPSGVSASGNVNLTATGSLFLGSNLTLSSAALNTARDLVVESGKALTVPAAGQLTVSRTLTNSAGNSGLVIESGGSLLHSSNSVAATVKREITGSATLTQKKYHFVSIPTQYASPTSNLFLGSHLYKLDPTQLYSANQYGTWVGLGTSTTTPLALGQGYMVYYPNTSQTYTFEGNLNNGSYTYSLTGHSGAGVYTFNLVPNPYPSAIVWNTGDAGKWPTSTGVGGSCYIWNANSGNYSTVASGASSHIPSGQAFMVLVTNQASPTLSLNNNARVHSSQAFYKPAAGAENRLVVKADANDYADETVIAFREDATRDFDLQTDGMKLSGLEDAPQLYTLSADNRYSINNLPMFTGQESVPLHFETTFAGEVTLTFSGMDSFDPEMNLYLRDDLSGQMINLRNQAVYSFQHNPANIAGRFMLVFGRSNSLEETSRSQNRLWISGDQLHIHTPCLSGKTGKLEVFNSTGKLLLAKNILLNDHSAISLQTHGLVMVKLTAGEEVMTLKGLIP